MIDVMAAMVVIIMAAVVVIIMAAMVVDWMVSEKIILMAGAMAFKNISYGTIKSRDFYWLMK